MKKVILMVAMVFATSSLVNANTVDKINKIEVFLDCASEAWEFGTYAGNGHAAQEYYYTNLYYERNC